MLAYKFDDAKKGSAEFQYNPHLWGMLKDEKGNGKGGKGNGEWGKREKGNGKMGNRKGEKRETEMENRRWLLLSHLVT